MKIYEYIVRIKDQASNALKRLSGSSSMARSGLGQLSNFASSAGSSLFNLGNIASMAARYIGPAALGAALLFTGKQAVTLAADLEQTRVGFEVMLGSAEKANKMIADLRTMAKFTPFETTDLVKATETMLGFGIAGEKILPTLNMLGDVSRGNAEKLRLITLAYSQIQSAGRLTGQDLLQLVNAGFNPLQEISVKTGLGMAQLKKRMEDGAISADMVTDAFRSATSEGGRFFGMMDKQSKTFYGIASTLRDEWNEQLIILGEKILPTAIKTLQWLRQLLVDITTRVDFTPLVSAFNDFFDSISGVFDIFSELFVLFGISYNQVSTLQVVFNGLALAIRLATTPLRGMLLGFSLLIELGKTVIGVLKAIALTYAGIFTLDIDMIKEGIASGRDVIINGLQNINSKVFSFIKGEYEGIKGIFTTGPKGADEVAATGKGDLSTNSGKQETDSKLKSGLDKITGGGKQAVNVTINLDNLIGVQNFDVKNIKETVKDMEKLTVEALLRVLNSANYAAAQ